MSAVKLKYRFIMTFFAKYASQKRAGVGVLQNGQPTGFEKAPRAANRAIVRDFLKRISPGEFVGALTRSFIW